MEDDNRRRIDQDHKGLKLASKFMLLECAIIVILLIGTFLYRRFG